MNDWNLKKMRYETPHLKDLNLAKITKERKEFLMKNMEYELMTNKLHEAWGNLIKLNK